jgi:PhnB protein
VAQGLYALKRYAMNETSDRSHFTPQGWHTVTPRIVVHEAQLLVEFVKYVFRATGEYQPDAPAVLSIGDSIVMISDAGIRDPAGVLVRICRQH